MSIKEDQVDNEDVIDEEIIEEEEKEAIESSEVSEEDEPETNQEEDEDDEDDRIVTIGEAPPEAEEESVEEDEDSFSGKPAPKFVKTLRKVNRKQESEIRQLRRQLEANKKAAEIEKPVELGEEPTLESCNFDDKKFAQEVVSYHDRKKKVEEQAAKKAKAVEEQNKAYKARQDLYVAKKQEHNFKDYTEAEELVSSTLSETQQGIIIEGAKDSALLVYALGKNSKKLEELAKISNPINFTYALAELESQLKVTKKTAPRPESRITGVKSGGIAGSGDKTLARLRADADKTGDYTKVAAYRRKLREKE